MTPHFSMHHRHLIPILALALLTGCAQYATVSET